MHVTAKSSIISSPPPLASAEIHSIGPSDPADVFRFSSSLDSVKGRQSKSSGRVGGPFVYIRAEAIRFLTTSVWGGVGCAFLGIFSSRGRLHTGFWANGGHHGPHSVRNERSPRRRGLRIGASNVVLRARARPRGLRDAEYSGISTPPPRVPAEKSNRPAEIYIRRGGLCK